MIDSCDTEKREAAFVTASLSLVYVYKQLRICLDFTVYMCVMDFSVYLRLFLAPLPSRFLQIDHYLLHPEGANLLKNPS